MDNTERFSVRLTSETVAVLNSFIESGEYNSLNEVMMAAISDFIMSRLEPGEIRKALEDAYSKKPIDPKSLMADDEPMDMDAAIRIAVEKYIRGKMEGQR